MPPKKGGRGSRKRAASTMGNGSSRPKPNNDTFVDAPEMAPDPLLATSNRTTILNLRTPRQVSKPKSTKVSPERGREHTPSPPSKNEAVWRPKFIPPPPIPVIVPTTTAIEKAEGEVSPVFYLNREVSPAPPLPLSYEEQQEQQRQEDAMVSLGEEEKEDESPYIQETPFQPPPQDDMMIPLEDDIEEGAYMLYSHRPTERQQDHFYLNQQVDEFATLENNVHNICIKGQPQSYAINSHEIALVTEYICRKPDAPILLFIPVPVKNAREEYLPIEVRYNLLQSIELYRATEYPFIAPTDFKIMVQRLEFPSVVLSEEGLPHLKVLLSPARKFCYVNDQGREIDWHMDPFDPHPSGPHNWKDWIKTPSPSPAPEQHVYYRKPDATPFLQYVGEEQPYILEMVDGLPNFSVHTSCIYAVELHDLREAGGLGMLPDTIIPFTWDDISDALSQLYKVREIWEEDVYRTKEEAKRKKIWLRTISFYIQILLRQDGKTWMEIFQLHSKYT